MITFNVSGVDLDMPENQTTQVVKPNSIFNTGGISVAYTISSILPFSDTNIKAFNGINRDTAIVKTLSFPCNYYVDGKQQGYGTLHVIDVVRGGFKVSLSLSDFIEKALAVAFKDTNTSEISLGETWASAIANINAIMAGYETTSEFYRISRSPFYFPIICNPDFYDGFDPTFFDGFFNNFKFNQGGETAILPQYRLAPALKQAVEYIGFTLVGNVYQHIDDANWCIIQNYDPRRGLTDDTVVAGISGPAGSYINMGSQNGKIPFTVEGIEDGRDDKMVFDDANNEYVATSSGNYTINFRLDMRLEGDGSNNLSDSITVFAVYVYANNAISQHIQVYNMPNNNVDWYTMEFSFNMNIVPGTANGRLSFTIQSDVNEGLFQNDLEDVWIKNGRVTYTFNEGGSEVIVRGRDLLPEGSIGSVFAEFCKSYGLAFDLDPIAREISLDFVDPIASKIVKNISDQTGDSVTRPTKQQSFSLQDNVYGSWKPRPETVKVYNYKADLPDNSDNNGAHFKVLAEDAIYIQVGDDANFEYVCPENLGSNPNGTPIKINRQVMRPAMSSFSLQHDNGVNAWVVMPYFKEKGRWSNESDGQNERLPFMLAFGHYGTMGQNGGTQADYHTLHVSTLGSTPHNYDADPDFITIKSVIYRQRYAFTTIGIWKALFYPVYQFRELEVMDTRFSLFEEQELRKLKLHEPVQINFVNYLIKQIVYNHKLRGISPAKLELLRLLK